jgi:putative chitinase
MNWFFKLLARRLAPRRLTCPPKHSLGLEPLEAREVPARILTLSNPLGGQSSLQEVETITGQVAYTTFLSGPRTTDIATTPSGKLYGIQTGFNSGSVVQINPRTGEQTPVVQSPTLASLMALTAAGDGTLYAVSGGRGLVRIDLSAGTVVRVGDLTVVNAPPFSAGGMSYDGDLAVVGGSLFYASAALYRIDPATAVATQVGPVFDRASFLPKNYPGLVAADDQLLGIDWMGQVVAIDPATGQAAAAGNVGSLWVTGAAPAVSITPPPPPSPPADVAAGGIGWQPRTGNLRVLYTVRGGLPANVTGEVFWATGPTAADRVDPAVHMYTLDRRPGEHEYAVPAEALRNAPAWATHLVVALDGLAGGRVAETDETNNVVALALGVTGEQMLRLNPTLPTDRVASFVAPLNAAMSEFGIRSAGQKAAFLAQVGHESTNLTRWEENLNYTSVARLRAVFPSKFPSSIPNSVVRTYLNNPERLANYVYANRNGNGNEASGDGWRFRGRGPFQLTGRANYEAVNQALGYARDPAFDLLANPDQVADWQNQPIIGLRTAARFFATKVPIVGAQVRQQVVVNRTLTAADLRQPILHIADRVNPARRQSIIDINRVVSIGVNGGTNGLHDRLDRFHRGLVLFLGADRVARL